MWRWIWSILSRILPVWKRVAVHQPKVPVRPWLMPFNAPRDETIWQKRWREQGQSWRTEPEIDLKRQAALAMRLSVSHNEYPFVGMALTRGDLEWLLVTHHGGRGPVNWDDVQDRRREGLDLRGAILRGENLRNLPLTCLFARDGDFEGVSLVGAHLEAADFVGTNLQRANLSFSYAEQAGFGGAHLELANLTGAKLQGASFKSARLTGATLIHTDLTQAHDLARTDFTNARLEGAELLGAYMEDVNFGLARLELANLSGAHLEGANLQGACLAGAKLPNAHLERADLSWAHLEGKEVAVEDLVRIKEWLPDFPATLLPADLRLIFFDNATMFNNIELGDSHSGFPRVADVRWEGANLAVIDWASVSILGDELIARKNERADRELLASMRAYLPRRVLAVLIALRPNQSRRFRRVSRAIRRFRRVISEAMGERQQGEYQEAVRANRQVATALRAQGLNEDASRFAYRAQVLNRQVLRRQGAFGRLALSKMSDILAGYGYDFQKSACWYVGVILVAASAYYLLGTTNNIVFDWARLVDALAESVTAFHGRGLFSDEFHSGDPRSLIAAAEAVFGLIIEICFIVTFTQRFFEK